MRHSRATLQPLNVPQQFCATPLGNITASKCSPTEPRDTLGRRYKPISFPNSSARHPRATLQAYIVPQQGRAALSGDITAPKRSPSVLRGTLGQHYRPISFHNRAARHSLATLQPLNVPHQFCAAPSGNTLPLFRRRNIRIDPVMNKPGDTFGTPWATIQAHIATPTEPHCTFGRHYYVPERVVDYGAAGCNCSPKKG